MDYVLAQCPFCASSNVGVPQNIAEGQPIRWITCYDCGADGPLVSKRIKKPLQPAITLWNRRKLLQLGDGE